MQTHTNEVMTDAELFNAIGNKVKALRDEADKLELFASNMSITATLRPNPGETRGSTVKSREVAHEKSGRASLADRIKEVIAGSPNGVIERKEIIKAIKTASRGKIKHIAVVATLRNGSLFKDHGNGLFSLVSTQ